MEVLSPGDVTNPDFLHPSLIIYSHKICSSKPGPYGTSHKTHDRLLRCKAKSNRQRWEAAVKEGRGLFFKIVQAEKQKLTRNTLHFARSLCFSLAPLPAEVLPFPRPAFNLVQLRLKLAHACML